MRLTFENADDWSLARTSGTTVRRQRGAAAAPGTTVPPEFLLPGVTVEEVVDAAPSATRRGAATPVVEVSVDCGTGESAVVAVRHESGAITFHAPVLQELQPARRRGAGAGKTVHFQVPVRQSSGARRGILGAAVRFILLKIKDAAVDAALGAVIRLGGVALEQYWWAQRGLQEGWFQVVPNQNGLQLRAAQPAAKRGARSLLLLHGTFSNAASAFPGLATGPGGFVDKAKAIYGDRIYAFNHFTITRTLEENARMLLEGLPDSEQTFDVITHSRGGLVLRTLIEQRSLFPNLAGRFRVNQAILVVAPNQGTPLATPARFEATIGMVANLLEMFPDNPWTTGAEFVAHGITWLASSLIANLPGLAAMDGKGPTIDALQEPSQVQPGTYAALAANFSPTESLWRRLVDAGIDSFFAGANDLVVPAEGGWLIDGMSALAVASDRIGCFGPGGNIRANSDGLVHHLNVMKQPETIQFLLQTLNGESTSLAMIDPLRPLPSRRLLRGGSRLSGVTQELLSVLPAALTSGSNERAEDRGIERRETVGLSFAGTALDDTLHLIILESSEPGKKQVLATFGSARVVDEFPTQDPKGIRQSATAPITSGTRFQEIIETHQRIRMCLEGIPAKKTGKVPELPNEAELLAFGEHLFETLFGSRVRRLYDVARSQQAGRPLNLIFTSTVPWLAALPWEFAFDPSRRKFLVTEEVHFIRNVLTSVPAQNNKRTRRALRMLVVAAQPIGTVPLSAAEEKDRIRHGFAPLTDAGLLELDVLTDATPARLHGKIQSRELESSELDSRQYDIVHFIGHGEFDKHANQGKLLFQTRTGGRHDVDVRTLREFLCGRGIQLVFLNACDTARDTHATLNRGIAQALVEGGIPAVVANQYPVLDDSAVGFTDHFYWSLALGASLGEAAREARIALNYSISHESIDWAIPVLFARDPTFRLCAGRSDVKTPPPAAVEGVPRVPRETEPPRPRTTTVTMAAADAETLAPTLSRVIRVGVADLTRFFKELDDTLAHLNDVQDRFVFETVDVVAPLGAWEFKAESGKRARSYLHAERFAKMLKDKPRELGVDFLACVTNRRMRDDYYYDIYGWWSSEAELPILLFSTSGLALDDDGLAARRAVANQLVESIGAQLLDSTTHRDSIHVRPPKSCPFYFNGERDLDLIVGRREFDKTCRNKLLEKLPKELNPKSIVAAFDAILRAFDDATVIR